MEHRRSCGLVLEASRGVMTAGARCEKEARSLRETRSVVKLAFFKGASLKVTLSEGCPR